MHLRRRSIGMTFGLVGGLWLTLPSMALATATTHNWAPSTNVQPYKLWHATVDMYCPAERGTGGHIPTVTNVGFTIGVLPWKGVNAETGFDHKSGLGVADNYPLYRNIKIGIPENAWGSITPGLAVGAFDLGTRKYATNYNVFYANAAKSIAVDNVTIGRFSLGYFSGNDKLLLDEGGESDNTGVVAALERTMSEISDKLWICAEYMGSHSGYGTWNVGASWKFAPNVSVILG